LSQKLSKRDKLGIHSKIENLCLEILSLSIETSLKSGISKKIPLELLRIKISIIQNLIRTENELKIIGDKSYLHLSVQVTEISKMTNGWLNYINTKGA
jgi:hypothetical protein